MKVVHVIEAMHRGGAESLLAEHARHAGPGVETVIVALNRGGPALERAREAGAAVHVLRDPRRGALANRVGGLFALAGLLRRERADVVNGHNPAGGLWACAAARLAGIPVALRTEHSLHYPGRYSRVYPLLEGIATVLTRRVVCVCQAVRESHVRRLPWASRRFVTVANGIASAPHTRPREETRRALGLAASDSVVLTVGSLTPQKDQATLLEAFARVARTRDEARLLIAGEGALRADLERRRDALGLGDRVRFLGDREDVADLLEACDLFVLSSVREGLSVTLLEAMRAGRAVVATDVGGNAEAVARDVTGRIVATRDPRALAGALESLLGDPARREAFGSAARARFAERFTAERMVRETEALYREALAEAGRPAAAGEARHAPA
jgi:glycosyltransferase involved in cell wall biosynthesis